ncbi:ATP-binding protein [Streptomyces sp. NPDC050546]|uniref:ATP-binding protein n=1 Tax=Streptomyces sp. NPDC050546 TaxID=3365628 RepID=UPI00379E77F5
MIALVVLCGAVVVWQTVRVGTGWLLSGAAGGLLVAAMVGTVRARTVARAVEGAHQVQLRQVTEAVLALEKLMLWSADELCRGGTPAVPDSPPLIGEAGLAEELMERLGEVQVQAVASLIRVRDESRSVLLLSMLHQFSKREHALIDRALEMLDQLQDQTEDPDQLDTLYKLDHLVTRMRRWVESKAVAGGRSLRSAREPVTVMQVLRGAVQEILHYSRVTVTPGTVGVELGFPRHVGPDLTHLLAELVENGTQFSDPASKVQLRAQRVAKGLAIEVEDRVAIPMRATDRERWNRLLANPDQVDVSAEVRDGRLGLMTTALIARNYGISVELKENVTGGTTALVVVPDRLLVTMPVPVTAAPAVPPARPPEATSVQASAPRRASHASPAEAQAASAARVRQALEAPALPQRVVGGSPQRPGRPSRVNPPATAPRYGLAGAFHDGIKAARAQDRTAPAEGPEASSGPSGPPTAHP